MNSKTSLVVLSIFFALAAGGVTMLYVTNGGHSGEDMRHATVDPASIRIQPPPADTSEETKADIAVLLDYKASRTTEEFIQTTQNETTFDAVHIGPYTVGEYYTGTLLPKMRPVLLYSLPELERVLAIKQAEFNRARPSAVEPTIEPVVNVPGSPSYPGEYSSKSHFLALVLSYIDPARKNDYLSRADEVALQQEVAGIQYPLDNAVGAAFGYQFFDEVMKDPEFVARLDAAKAEWAAANIPSGTDIPEPTE